MRFPNRHADLTSLRYTFCPMQQRAAVFFPRCAHLMGLRTLLLVPGAHALVGGVPDHFESRFADGPGSHELVVGLLFDFASAKLAVGLLACKLGDDDILGGCTAPFSPTLKGDQAVHPHQLRGMQKLRDVDVVVLGVELGFPYRVAEIEAGKGDDAFGEISLLHHATTGADQPAHLYPFMTARGSSPCNTRFIFP